MTAADFLTAELRQSITPPDKVELDPLSLAAIMALIQGVMQVVVACFPEPEDAAAWVEGEWRPQPGWLVPGLRPWRLRQLVAQQWRGDKAHLPQLQATVAAQLRGGQRTWLIHGLYETQRPALFGKPMFGARSPRWRSVRADHLVANPTCAVCGTIDHLEVHHVVPYHVDKSRELDPGNLLTLCESPSHNCHFIFGHLLNWSNSNPRVREMAEQYLALREESRRRR